MTHDEHLELAGGNLNNLRFNPYPGRGIVAGLDQDGKYLVQVYWIMGRSQNSRNRVFKKGDVNERLYTVAADPAKVEDPSLIIYNAMLRVGNHHIVSNGDQTDTVFASEDSSDLGQALKGRTYEPDYPNFTQRITAVCSNKPADPLVTMSIIRKPAFGLGRESSLFSFLPVEGFGRCITTYARDGDPLPPFCGDPLPMPLFGDMTKVAATYWDALNEENRVSLAVKFISREDGASKITIINQYKQSN